MVSDEEAARTVNRGRWYAILPMLPELQADGPEEICLQSEFSSAGKVMDLEETRDLLERNGLLLEEDSTPANVCAGQQGQELLR